jgi:3'-phosphoadenosine 5'-phosphosulfate sulfotransferase (PAPS reductase)/FAD synthetase
MDRCAAAGRSPGALRLLQSLPPARKVDWSLKVIRDGVEEARGLGLPCHVNISGGVDSVVLAALTKRAGYDLPLVFADTGVEFTAIARFARSMADVIVKPRMPFHKVVKKYGYPAIGKDQARYLYDLQNPSERNAATRRLRLEGIKRDGTPAQKGSVLAKRYRHLVTGPRISDSCCYWLKHTPLDEWAKANGRSVPLVGVQAEESDRRARDWLAWGCIGLKKGTPKISPLMIWRKTDVLQYILDEGLPYCHEIYGDIQRRADGVYYTTKEQGTGCCGCLFGCFYDKQRFVRLRKIDRKKWNYFMACGAREVLAALGLPSGEEAA